MLNRDTASRLAISSPLEAHKSHAIVFHTCGVDVGFDNPIFAVSFTLPIACCGGALLSVWIPFHLIKRTRVPDCTRDGAQRLALCSG